VTKASLNETDRPVGQREGCTNAPHYSTSLLIDTKAAARLLSLSPRRLFELTACKAIPSLKIGRSRRYRPEELSAWVDAGCPTEPGAGEAIRLGVA